MTLRKGLVRSRRRLSCVVEERFSLKKMPRHVRVHPIQRKVTYVKILQVNVTTELEGFGFVTVDFESEFFTGRLEEIESELSIDIPVPSCDN